jgi:hypothetical protein
MRTNIESSSLYDTRQETARIASVRQATTATVTLLRTSPIIQEIDPSGAAVNVVLPAVSIERFFVIANTGSSGSLVVLDALGALVSTVLPGRTLIAYATPRQWVVLIGGSSGPAPAAITVVGSGAIASTVTFVWTNQAGAIALTLPDAAAWELANAGLGVPLSIFDTSGTAAANNVTITPFGAQTINGLANLTIADNYGGYRLRPRPSGGWVMV